LSPLIRETNTDGVSMTRSPFAFFFFSDLAYRIIVTARAISNSVTVVITPVAESEIRQNILLFKIETSRIFYIKIIFLNLNTSYS